MMFSHTGEPSSSAIMMHSATWRRVESGVDSSRVSRRMEFGSMVGAIWWLKRLLESAAGMIVEVGMTNVD